MSDIAMCQGQNCSVGDTCYRHIAEPEPLQVWAPFWADATFRPETGCAEYWPLKKLPNHPPPESQHGKYARLRLTK